MEAKANTDKSNSSAATGTSIAICATTNISISAIARTNASGNLGLRPVTESTTQILMIHFPNCLPHPATDTRS